VEIADMTNSVLVLSEDQNSLIIDDIEYVPYEAISCCQCEFKDLPHTCRQAEAVCTSSKRIDERSIVWKVK
jgi:hypothetical protein